MAGSDYYNCDNCGKGKIFYDANIDWADFGERIGQLRCICSGCYNAGVRLNISTIEGKNRQSNNPGVHGYTSESLLNGDDEDDTTKRKN